MALKTLVKISSVNNLSDARYGAGMGVGLIGFCLDQSNKAYINFEKFSEITNWISGVKIVGEFGNSSIPEIRESLTSYKPDLIQVNNLNQIIALENTNIPIILSVDTSDYSITALEELLKEAKAYVTYFLIESSNSDNHNIASYITLSKKFPIILDVGVTIENVNSIITQSDIKGIALKGGNEIKPGIRDFDEMADILEFLEAE